MKKEDIGLGFLILIVVLIVVKIATYDFAGIEHKKPLAIEANHTEVEKVHVEKHPETIVEKVQEIVADVKTEITKEKVTAIVEEKVEVAKELVKEVKQTVSEVANDAKEEIKQSAEKIAAEISKKLYDKHLKRENNLVSDSNTNLMWQDDIAAGNTVKPLITSQNFYAEDYNNTNGNTAYNYCDTLNLGGFDDYRLPSIDELKTLVNKNNTKFVFETFENITKYNYWSSTISAHNVKDTWYLYTSLGYADVHPKSYSLYVRCVRDTK